MTCVLLVLTLVVVAPAQAFLTDYETHAPVARDRPELDNPQVDPTFGTTITRRTDPSQSPSAGTNQTKGLPHEYSKYAAVNADNTRMAVQVVGGAQRGTWEIRDVATYALVATLPTDGDPEISWHPTQANRLLYRAGNTVRAFAVDTGTVTTLMTFAGYTAVSSHEEGRPSDDGRYWAGIGVKANGQHNLLVADLQDKTTIATLANVGTAVDWVSMSPSGNYVVAQFTDSRGTRVYDRTLTQMRPLVKDHAHSDLARDREGNEILVYVAVTGAQLSALGCPHAPGGSPIASARLSDSTQRILLGDCYTAEWQPVITGVYLGWWFDMHFSGLISRQRPGWVVVSTYTTPGATPVPFADEVFLLATDGSGKVERLAHHHSQVGTLNGKRDYYAEPHCVSSWDATHVHCASTWGATGNHYDLYEIGTGAAPPTPPTPLPEESGPYTCTWLWDRDAHGRLLGFATHCVRDHAAE